MLAGIIALGDSLCAFDPMCGQVMTVAAVRALIAASALAVVMVGIAGWFATERMLRVKPGAYLPRVRVREVTPTQIRLSRSDAVLRPGTYGITWSGGYAVVGEVLGHDTRSVTRRLVSSPNGLSAGMVVRWDLAVHSGDPARTCGLRYTDMSIPGELGALPAWLVPGSRSTWVLLVHGLGGTREEGLRILPTLAELGFPVLLLTYRNDPGAAASPDRYHHLGDSEWRDLEAAVVAATASGASDVVLYGWSMGGLIIENYLHRAADITPISAVVLDSPLFDWRASIAAQVRQLHLPHWFTSVLLWFIDRKTRVDPTTLNHLGAADQRRLPTLLFHGVGDRLIPIASSDAFAAARPDLITYHRVHHADHTETWNTNPTAYESAVRAFLSGR